MDSHPPTLHSQIGSVPQCASCGSECIVKDAWAIWNSEFGLWELEQVFDHAVCRTCEAPTSLTWVRQDVPPNKRIRELNDRFRRDGVGTGSMMLTRGIQERGGAFAVAAVQAVRGFAAFTDDNDPWGEHGFGALEVLGEKVFFKIDYYDPSLEKGSENPANEGLTHRVLTIMLASEY